MTFADGIELDIIDVAEDNGSSNGIMFNGEKGRFFVNRGKLVGKSVEELQDNPLPAGALEAVYPGAGSGKDTDDIASVTTHMQNFLDCVKSRQAPVSDAETILRHLAICHTANIALRLGRKLTFDPATEQFVNDEQANGFLAREQRKGFEV